ncbi:DUF3618 domain-containing protein [Herbiconiux solani]|uniref:DUF3618 domain-containing protein n=1 Tax=Herbiconiux solani TaxID=661329 RepID=UPI0008256D10|nr:DUF3618 domain-containing protein [Herbiconiux solani]
MAKKKSEPDNQQLSVPAAVTQVARGVVTARAVKTNERDEDAEPAPKRSRAELQADIKASRAELTGVLDEIQQRLDVPARAQEIAGDFRADPMTAARTHKKTTATAVVLVAAVGTGIGFLIRAIVK